jgi:hypothetical protein
VKGLREKFAEKRRSGFGSAGGDKQGYRRKEIRESGDDSTSCLLVWKEERRRLEEGKPLLIKLCFKQKKKAGRNFSQYTKNLRVLYIYSLQRNKAKKRAQKRERFCD